MFRFSVDDLPVGSEAATSCGISRHGAQSCTSLSLLASSSSSSVFMPTFVINSDSDKLATTALSQYSDQNFGQSQRRYMHRFADCFQDICSQVINNFINLYYNLLYRFIDPPFPVSTIIPITDPVYIAKWEHMQHRPTITNFRKGNCPVTLTFDDGYIHDHIMVALAQYDWGKAEMLQDEHKATTYKLSFMVDPIEYCQHTNEGVPFCIHFKFIINDQWTLSREYYKVTECNGEVTNNYLCLSPADESHLRPRSGYVW